MAITISASYKNTEWTASWWNPEAYPIKFIFKNDGENTVVLKNIQWAIVAGNSGGYSITQRSDNQPYWYSGNSCTIAFYDEEEKEKLSSDVVIPKAPNCNLAQLDYNNTAILLKQNSYNDLCFFVPRYHSKSGNLEIAGKPEESQDTVEKVTRNIELLSGLEIAAGKTKTLILKSETAYTGILQVAPINTVTVNKGIIWVRENGVWVKKLYPHKYDSENKSWTDSGGHIMENSVWRDLG